MHIANKFCSAFQSWHEYEPLWTHKIHLHEHAYGLYECMSARELQIYSFLVIFCSFWITRNTLWHLPSSTISDNAWSQTASNSSWPAIFSPASWVFPPGGCFVSPPWPPDPFCWSSSPPLDVLSSMVYLNLTDLRLLPVPVSRFAFWVSSLSLASDDDFLPVLPVIGLSFFWSNQMKKLQVTIWHLLIPTYM